MNLSFTLQPHLVRMPDGPVEMSSSASTNAACYKQVNDHMETDISDEIKREFYKAVDRSVLLYDCPIVIFTKTS